MTIDSRGNYQLFEILVLPSDDNQLIIERIKKGINQIFQKSKKVYPDLISFNNICSNIDWQGIALKSARS